MTWMMLTQCLLMLYCVCREMIAMMWWMMLTQCLLMLYCVCREMIAMTCSPVFVDAVLCL